jgi:hypothetical protein
VQPAGRAWQENVGVQPPRHPAVPVPGQLAVALVPLGQTPLAGTAVHATVPQSWRLTQSWSAVQVVLPQLADASPPPSTIAPSRRPPSVPPFELQPAAMSRVSSAYRSDRVDMPKMLTRSALELDLTRVAATASPAADRV